jgi:hypothetical protein
MPSKMTKRSAAARPPGLAELDAWSLMRRPLRRNAEAIYAASSKKYVDDSRVI